MDFCRILLVTVSTTLRFRLAAARLRRDTELAGAKRGYMLTSSFFIGSAGGRSESSNAGISSLVSRHFLKKFYRNIINDLLYLSI